MAFALKASNEFWTASNANSPALTLVVASEKSSIKFSKSLVKIFSAPFLALITLPPPKIDFSAKFSAISIYLFSLPIPGVINPSAASSILDVPFFNLSLDAESNSSAFSASLEYFNPLNPIFLIIAGIALPIASADIPVAKPLNISFAKSSLGSKVCANPAAAPSPTPAPSDLTNNG